MSKEPVSRHDIAGIWVAFFSRCQRYRCRQASGVLHGKIGQATHGYYEASPNHDAVFLRIVNASVAVGRTIAAGMQLFGKFQK